MRYQGALLKSDNFGENGECDKISESGGKFAMGLANI